LRIYLGAAPVVGKTDAMSGVGRRAAGSGRKVLAGLIETRGRPRTAAPLRDREVVPADVSVPAAQGAGTGPQRWRIPRLPERRRPTALPMRRRRAGWIIALALPSLTTLVLSTVRGTIAPSGGLPELLFAVVVTAVVGGLLPALLGAVVGFVLADWFLLPPVHSLTVDRADNLVTLACFLVIAVLVSVVIDRLSRRNVEMARARAESEALARLAGGAVLAPREALSSLVAELRAAFGVVAVAVLHPLDDDAGWTVAAAAGGPVPTRPEEASFAAELAEGSVLVVTGAHLSADDRRLFDAFVSQLRAVEEQQRWQRTEATLSALQEANELRIALLTAVSHDLRTPLASIKAAATSLLSSEIEWDVDARRAFCETIDAEADRLNRIVADLLDMSRLQAGLLPLRLSAVALDEVVFAALASLSGDTDSVRVDVPETLTPVLADRALLERSIANLLANPLAWRPAGGVVSVRSYDLDSDAHHPAGPVTPVLATDRRRGARRGGARGVEACGVELHIVDTGPGIPVEDRESVFQPFERLAERDGGHVDGVGLGLAVARGFVHLMGGRLVLDETPGGGLTAVIALPTAPARPVAAADGPGSS
jgi:two-component system sensor histidine kinase KdpD